MPKKVRSFEEQRKMEEEPFYDIKLAPEIARRIGATQGLYLPNRKHFIKTDFPLDTKGMYIHPGKENADPRPYPYATNAQGEDVYGILLPKDDQIYEWGMKPDPQVLAHEYRHRHGVADESVNRLYDALYSQNRDDWDNSVYMWKDKLYRDGLVYDSAQAEQDLINQLHKHRQKLLEADYDLAPEHDKPLLVEDPSIPGFLSQLFFSPRTNYALRQRFPSDELHKADGGAVGSELTPEQYKTYGQGPEHAFFPDRAIPAYTPLPGTGSSQIPNPQPVKASSGSKGASTLQNLATLGVLGYGGYKAYKALTDGKGIELPDWAKAGIDKVKDFGKGVGSALGIYKGTQEGGVGGAGQIASSLGDLSNLGQKYGITPVGGYGNTLGGVGDVLSGVNQGGIEGYSKSLSGGLKLANQAGYSNAMTDAVSKSLGPAMSLYGAYQGLKGAKAAYDVGDVKGGMLSGVQTGASLGSIVPGLGTAAGAIIGGTLGILGTSMSGKSNQDNLNINAWKQYKDAYKNGDSVDFRNSGFPISFAYNAAPRDAALKQWTGENGPSGGMQEASAYLYPKLKQTIMDAQDAGKLPMDDAQLAQINGREFFNKEIAPQIWKNGKAPNAETQRLIADWYDTQFASGVDADRNPQKYKNMSDNYLRTNGDGQQYFDEAASRTASAQMNQLGGWEAYNAQHSAKGGKISRGDSMNFRGALSQVRPLMGAPRGVSDTSYYTYGAQRPAQPPMSGAPALAQMPQLRRAMGGGASFGYNRGGDPNLVRGPGTGRSDDIPARLSDGEYVWDAETVALLGDGSTDEGARRLDALRKKLRMHKGKNLAKGKFSANAKKPEDYLR